MSQRSPEGRRIIILGARGMLGSALRKVFDDEAPYTLDKEVTKEPGGNIGNPGAPTWIRVAGINSEQVNNLLPGKSYYVVFKEKEIILSLPVKPISVSILEIMSTTAKIKWGVLDTVTEGFRLRLSTDNINWSATQTTSQMTITFVSLLPDTEYFIEIRAYNKTGQSEPAKISLRTKVGEVPPMPQPKPPPQQLPREVGLIKLSVPPNEKRVLENRSPVLTWSHIYEGKQAYATWEVSLADLQTIVSWMVANDEKYTTFGVELPYEIARNNPS